jgi:hypothetical protein
MPRSELEQQLRSVTDLAERLKVALNAPLPKNVPAESGLASRLEGYLIRAHSIEMGQLIDILETLSAAAKGEVSGFSGAALDDSLIHPGDALVLELARLAELHLGIRTHFNRVGETSTGPLVDFVQAVQRSWGIPVQDGNSIRTALRRAQKRGTHIAKGKKPVP